MKKLGIIGCGWLGIRIAGYLSGRFEIYSTTSSGDKAEKLAKKGCNPTVVYFGEEGNLDKHRQWNVLPELDIIVIAVQFSGKNVTKERIQELLLFVAGFKGQLFFMSTTGVYPGIEGEYVEADISPESVLAEGMVKYRFSQVNVLRLAGLMGDERLLRNFKIVNPELAVNHIHYLDICSVLERMIDRQSHAKLYNVVAPFHPSKYEVINAQNNIPYAAEGQVKGKRVSGEKLVSELNFVFKFPDPRCFHL